jgi:hypothetical protein
MGLAARFRSLQSSPATWSADATRTFEAFFLSASQAEAAQYPENDRPVYSGIYGAVYRNVLPRRAGDVSYRYRGD